MQEEYVLIPFMSGKIGYQQAAAAVTEPES